MHTSPQNPLPILSVVLACLSTFPGSPKQHTFLLQGSTSTVVSIYFDRVCSRLVVRSVVFVVFNTDVANSEPKQNRFVSTALIFDFDLSSWSRFVM